MNVTRITDLLSGKNVAEYYALYNKTQWFTKDEMKAFQLDKLRKLIQHSYTNVPYYKEVMDQKGLKPADVQSLDILEEFPVITKEIIKDNYDSFLPANLDKIKGVKMSQTGGTTGGILYTRNDSDTRSSTWAAFKRFEDWMRVGPRDKSLILMGGHVIGDHWKDKLKKIVKEKLRNRIAFSPYNTTEDNILNIINALKNNDFKLIRSYSQFLFLLAKRLKEENLSFHVNAITTTAEPLTAEHRTLFSEVFKAGVFDQYGFGEIGGLAFECDHHQGMHIAEERAIVEINKNNELIVTDLDNYALPFIRYWNADQAILSSEPCSCGRQSPMIKQLMGRTCDYIIGVNNEYLHWAYFWHLFFDSELADKRKLKKFQIVQSSKDELKIRMVSDVLTEEEEQLLVSNIQNRAGRIKVTFSFEDNIENASSGKYRPVINELL